MARMKDFGTFLLSGSDWEFLEALMEHETVTKPEIMLSLLFAENWLDAQENRPMSKVDKEDFRPFTVVPLSEKIFKVSTAEEERILRSACGEQEISELITHLIGIYGRLATKAIRNKTTKSVFNYLKRPTAGAITIQKFK
ncbi:MAG: hypothetical protein WCI57_03440 [Candidatus Berkelbacteria bacterium]